MQRFQGLHAREVRRWLGVSDSTFRIWQRAILPEQRSVFDGIDICLFLILEYGIQREGFRVSELAPLNWLDLHSYIDQTPLPQLMNQQLVVDIEEHTFRISSSDEVHKFEFELNLFSLHFSALFWGGVLGQLLGKEGQSFQTQGTKPPALKGMLKRQSNLHQIG